MAEATARQMTEGWAAAMCAVDVSRWMCRSLRWAREASRARSGGVRACVRLGSLSLLLLGVGGVGGAAARRRGGGWPARERRI